MSAAIRPRTVTVAFWIWLFSAFVGIGAIVNVTAAVGLLSALTAGDDAWVVVEGAGIAFAVLLGIGVIVQVIAAVMFRDGANWARIVLVVTAAISSAGVIFEPTDIVSWLFLVANAIALVLSFAPEANAYFTARRRRSGLAGA